MSILKLYVEIECAKTLGTLKTAISFFFKYLFLIKKKNNNNKIKFDYVNHHENILTKILRTDI